MPARHIPRPVAAVITAVALAATLGFALGRPSPAMASTLEPMSHLRHTVPVQAHWETPPDSFVISPPCTDTDYIPATGLCHGTGAGNAVITGSWQGTSTYVYGFATTPANLSYLTVVETFTGTVTGCGTGTMTYRIAGTLDASGTLSTHWQIVDGFGSGDLSDVTGHGTQLGIYNADFTTTGDFSGHLKCKRH